MSVLAEMTDPQVTQRLNEFYLDHQSVIIEGVETVYYDSLSKSLSHHIDTPIVVALHGIPLSGYLYRNLISDLAQEYRLIIPDLPGFGRSQKRLTWPAKPKRYISWLSSFLEEVLPEKRKVYLVGHDFGAILALSWAQHKPEMTAGLLLTNTYLTIEYLYPPLWPITAAIPILGSSLTEHIGSARLISKLLKNSFYADPDPVLLACYTDVYHQKDARRLLANYLWHTNKMLNFIWQIRRGLSEIKCPVIFLFGEKDKYLRQESCEKLASYFKRSAYRLLPNVGYQLPDEASEVVTAELKALIVGNAPS